MGANALKSKFNEKVNTVDIIDNLLSTSPSVPLSANQGKVLKELIDGMSSGLLYRGTLTFVTNGDVINLRTSVVAPLDMYSAVNGYSKGDFFKITGNGFVNDGTTSLEVNAGDMLILNSDIAKASITLNEIDKIDNSESPDLLRQGHISYDADWTKDQEKLSTRGVIKTYVDNFATTASTFHIINDVVTLTGDTAVLTYAPKDGTIFMGFGQVQNPDGTIDLVSCSASGTTLTLVPDATGQYNGQQVKVAYIY